jgi:hypothetical protein
LELFLLKLNLFDPALEFLLAFFSLFLLLFLSLHTLVDEVTPLSSQQAEFFLLFLELFLIMFAGGCVTAAAASTSAASADEARAFGKIWLRGRRNARGVCSFGPRTPGIEACFRSFFVDIRPQNRRKADSAVVPVLGPVPLGLFEFGHIRSLQAIASSILFSICFSISITVVVVAMLYLFFLASVTRLLMLMLVLLRLVV